MEKSNQGWLSVASNIPAEKNADKQRRNSKKRKSKNNSIYVFGNKNTLQSSFMSSTINRDLFLDTSNYRQTNISSYLKKKRKKLEKQKCSQTSQDGTCSCGGTHLYHPGKKDVLDQNKEDIFDLEQFSQPVVSLTPKNSSKCCQIKVSKINLEIDTESLNDPNIDHIKLKGTKIDCMEQSNRTEKDENKSIIDENYFEERVKDFPDCTLLARLHEESCNTNLDPNFSKSCSTNSKNAADLFSKTSSTESNTSEEDLIRNLHKESCQTNLDPYTIVQSPSALLQDSCLGNLHESRLLTNLSSSELTVTGETFWDDSYQQSNPVVNITPTNALFDDVSTLSDTKTLPNRTPNEKKPSWTMTAIDTDEKLDNLGESLFNSFSSSFEISQPICSNINKEEKKQKTSTSNKLVFIEDNFWESLPTY